MKKLSIANKCYLLGLIQSIVPYDDEMMEIWDEVVEDKLKQDETKEGEINNERA